MNCYTLQFVFGDAARKHKTTANRPVLPLPTNTYLFSRFMSCIHYVRERSVGRGIHTKHILLSAIRVSVCVVVFKVIKLNGKPVVRSVNTVVEVVYNNTAVLQRSTLET